MKLRLSVNGALLAAKLYDSAASRDLLKLLPLELTLQDCASAEKIAYLPRKLDTAGAPAGFDPATSRITHLGGTSRSSIGTSRLPVGS